MYSSTSMITFLRTRVRVLVLKKYSYSSTSTSTRVRLLHLCMTSNRHRDMSSHQWVGAVVSVFYISFWLERTDCSRQINKTHFLVSVTRLSQHDKSYTPSSIFFAMSTSPCWRHASTVALATTKQLLELPWKTTTWLTTWLNGHDHSLLLKWSVCLANHLSKLTIITLTDTTNLFTIQCNPY